MNWDDYRCGICGGLAFAIFRTSMGTMSLFARCTKCQAYSTDYPPTQWQMQGSEGAD